MTGGGKLSRGGSFSCVKRQPWCESVNESPGIDDAMSLGGSCKRNWEKVLCQSRGQKELGR